MRSIQEVGLEIMNKTPKPFYVFCGSEYGIKLRYLDMLLQVYPKKLEYDSVQAVLSFFETKHIVPPEPAVYVVRYDQEFIKSLDNNITNRIAKCKINGCILCIYQDEKSAAKLDKYLPQYSVSIDTVSNNFMFKYLHTDFPHCPDRFINIAIEISSDYFQASSICRAMTSVSPEKLYAFTDDQLKKLFGGANASDDQTMKLAIAARNFSYVTKLVDNYEDDLNNILYSVMSTMIEIEKLQSTPYAQSVLSQYTKRWSREDVYNMFMQAYNTMLMSRTVSADMYSMVIYLLSLMQFSRIPSVEELS